MLGWTPDQRAWTGVGAAAASGALAVALFLAFLAIWVVTPAPVYVLLPFGVAVPELSPLLARTGAGRRRRLARTVPPPGADRGPGLLWGGRAAGRPRRTASGGRAPFRDVDGSRWVWLAPGRGRPADDEVFARYFAARGYVVAAIDYRHAPASRWPAQIDDPTRLVLVGRSAGAQLALVAVRFARRLEARLHEVAVPPVLLEIPWAEIGGPVCTLKR